MKQELFAVTLNKMVTNKVTGKKEPVKVKQPRSVVEYTIARKLLTMLPISVEEAAEKLHMERITAMDKNSMLTVAMVARNHPIDFKIVDDVIYHAR